MIGDKIGLFLIFNFVVSIDIIPSYLYLNQSVVYEQLIRIGVLLSTATYVCLIDKLRCIADIPFTSIDIRDSKVNSFTFTYLLLG